MGYTTEEPRLRIRHFCFFLGLRTGAIVSTVWWIISGMIFFLAFAYAAALGNKGAYTQTYSLTIISAMESLLIFVTAMFGLRALITRNSVEAIQMYTRMAWFFMVFLWTLVSTSILVVFLTSKCPSNSVCEQNWRADVIKLLAGISLTSTINIYGAIILQVYSMRREARLSCLKAPDKRAIRGSIISDVTGMSFSRTNSILSSTSMPNSEPTSLENQLTYHPSTFIPRRSNLNNVVVNNQVSNPSRAYFDDDNKISMDSSNDSEATIVTATRGIKVGQAQRLDTWYRGESEQNVGSLLGTMDFTQYTS